MPTVYKEMIASITLTATADVALYTAPTSTAAAIHAASVNNPTGAPVNVSLFKVPAAGTAGAPQKIAMRLVPANSVTTLFDAINHKLEPGTQLMAFGLGCGLNVSGVEYVRDN